MHAPLKLFDELSDADAKWLFSVGVKQQVPAHATIFREGEQPGAIYIVLEGLLGATADTNGDGMPHVPLGPGEIVGKRAFLEDQPASATVVAVERSLLLAVPRSTL